MSISISRCITAIAAWLALRQVNASTQLEGILFGRANTSNVSADSQQTVVRIIPRF
jgi:hypothetical protein